MVTPGSRRRATRVSGNATRNADRASPLWPRSADPRRRRRRPGGRRASRGTGSFREGWLQVVHVSSGWLTALETALEGSDEPVAAMAEAYRDFARRHPHLYRLMYDRSLDRSLLVPGSEDARPPR